MIHQEGIWFKFRIFGLVKWYELKIFDLVKNILLWTNLKLLYILYYFSAIYHGDQWCFCYQVTFGIVILKIQLGIELDSFPKTKKEFNSASQNPFMKIKVKNWSKFTKQITFSFFTSSISLNYFLFSRYFSLILLNLSILESFLTC